MYIYSTRFWYAYGMNVACSFLEYDGKILIVARQNHKTQKYEWDIPAAKVQVDESSIDAATRVVYAETGYRLAVDDIKSVGTFEFVSGNNEPYVMKAYKVTVESSPSLYSGNLRSEWATPAEVIKRDDLIKNFALLLKLAGYCN